MSTKPSICISVIYFIPMDKNEIKLISLRNVFEQVFDKWQSLSRLIPSNQLICLSLAEVELS